ncbi:MAG TPA: glycosyl hydrolase [Chloroflexia bacterium]
MSPVVLQPIPVPNTVDSPPSSNIEQANAYGIAGVMRWPDWGTFSRPIDAMLETGSAWVREDFVWGLIEPRERQYNWTATDRIVGNLHDRKVNVLGIISYSVNWATPAEEDDNSPSAVSFYAPDHDKYYLFVHGLVSRYKGTVHHWEIWNEPDNTLFWRPQPNAEEYAALLKVAYRAVKDADPTAKVLTGGVSGNAIPFLEEMMAGGGGASFDILALHPYAVPLNNAQARIESRPEVHKMVDVELNKYRAFLQRHNLDRPIWVTEMGWPARDWGLDDQAQADYLAQAYAQMLASGLVERIFWYSWKDSSDKPSDSWGLIAWGGGKTDLASRRPAFAAFATSARMLSGTKPAGRLQLAPYAVVVDFEDSTLRQPNTASGASANITSEQAHDGTHSLKLQYNFTGRDQAVDFGLNEPLALPGSAARIGLYVRGDGSGNYLSVWLRDRDGELFKVRLGSVTGSADGWRYYESPINNYYFEWERAQGSPANGKVDYPLSFVSFRLENTPDEPAGSGIIYIDGMHMYEGPDVSAVRFLRSDGQVVDVLWSVNPVTVMLPTGAIIATVTDRDGHQETVNATNGNVQIRVSSSPVYVIHTPGDAH